MQISLPDIYSFSKCPKRYWFLQKVRKKYIESNADVVTSIIKKAYKVALVTDYKVSWRRITGWINRHVFSTINIDDQESFTIAHRNAEYLIQFINTWYNNIYIPEQIYAYTDLYSEINVGSHLIHNTIPVVKTEDIPVIVSIGNKSFTDTQLKRHIQVCGNAMFLANELSCDIVKYQYLSIGDKGGFNVVDTHIDKKRQQNTLENIKQIAYAIYNKVNYPIINNYCEICPFNRRCKI